MMRRLLMLCALAAACSDYSTGSTQDPPTGTAVDVQDDFFSPPARSEQVGQSVRWTWRGGDSHNVTFADGPASPTQRSGSFERTFGSAGTFTYQCTVHGAAMSGSVTVTN